MILTDYFKSTHDICWDYALQCGVKNAVIRLPEDAEFDVTDLSHCRPYTSALPISALSRL